MSDDLRDRIAAVIRDHGTPVGLDTGEMDEFDCCAQAVIDALGLTLEERIDMPGRRGINPVRRVVGRWEAEL